MNLGVPFRNVQGFHFTQDAERSIKMASRISTGVNITPYDLILSLTHSPRGFGKLGIKENDVRKANILQNDLGVSLRDIIHTSVELSNGKDVDTPILAIAVLLEHGEFLRDILDAKQITIETALEILEESEEAYPPNTVLDPYCHLLNRTATQVYERDLEIHRIQEVLLRRQKRNVLLLGEPGVGKTAIVEGFAYLVAKKKLPEFEGALVYSLDLGSLWAGSKERGEIENRWKEISSELLQSKAPVVLFIDEIHNLLRDSKTSRSSNSDTRLSDLMKPFLARQGFFVIASTTEDEYQSSFLHDKAFERRFSIVRVYEPTVSSAIRILSGVKRLLEEHHRVEITDEAVEQAVLLSHRFIPNRKLPDKAIDVLDDSCTGSKVITKEDVSRTFERWFRRVPRDRVQMARELEFNLKKVVIGQDAAVEAVAKCISRSCIGLEEGGKPMGSFFFAGPTGVGKTLLAKELAHAMEASLHRIDCSEYMEPHDVSKLLGAPPGYIGYPGAGKLYEMLQKDPYNVLLIDEFEKANPKFQDIFLQILQDGVITDPRGRKIYFEDTVVIFTSNVAIYEKESIGFVSAPKNDPPMSYKFLKERFRPEFLNRLDAVIPFRPVSDTGVKEILENEARLVQERLYELYHITLVIEPSVLDYIQTQSNVREYGARQVRRMVSKLIETPVSEKILHDKRPRYLSLEIEDVLRFSN